MKVDNVNRRSRMIFTDEQILRIRLISKVDYEVEKIIVDVYGLCCSGARRFISNIVNVTLGECTVKVIHGYRHGTSIRQMLREKFFNPHISKIRADRTYLGVTYLLQADG